MKKKSFLVMAIAACCAVNYSCTSDFEDESVVPTAKRTTAQTWSPEVLQRARELGIIIVDEDRQWNNLTDEDVVFYLNLLTEKGDSAFLPADTPAPKPMGMLRRLGSNTIEDVGSTVHNYKYFYEYDKLADNCRLSVYIDWTVNKGKAENIREAYDFVYTGNEWDDVYFSGFLSTTSNGKNVDYRIDGKITFEREIINLSNEVEMVYKTILVRERGTATM